MQRKRGRRRRREFLSIALPHFLRPASDVNNKRTGERRRRRRRLQLLRSKGENTMIMIDEQSSNREEEREVRTLPIALEEYLKRNSITSLFNFFVLMKNLRSTVYSTRWWRSVSACEADEFTHTQTYKRIEIEKNNHESIVLDSHWILKIRLKKVFLFYK